MIANQLQQLDHKKLALAGTVGALALALSLFYQSYCRRRSKAAASAVPIFTLGSVISRDGTVVGYRKFCSGGRSSSSSSSSAEQKPTVVALHGGMQASQNFVKLAEALSDEFTVIVPDRRGRGMSGPYPDNDEKEEEGDKRSRRTPLQSDCEDVEALLRETGARHVFALSSGAVIAMQTAVLFPNAMRKLVLYEPPYFIDDSHPAYAGNWIRVYEDYLSRGDLASALATVIRSVEPGPWILRIMIPTWIMASLLRFFVMKSNGEIKDEGGQTRAREEQRLQVPIEALVPTFHYDAQIVMEARGNIERFKGIRAQVLLLGGSKSPAYLKDALGRLEKVIPKVRRVELRGENHVAAANDGNPVRVANELRKFFSEREGGEEKH